MEALVNLIMGNSTTLDVYVIVRLCVLCMVIEFVSLLAAYLGRLGR